MFTFVSYSYVFKDELIKTFCSLHNQSARKWKLSLVLLSIFDVEKKVFTEADVA